MKFVIKDDQPECPMCEKAYEPEKMTFIGIQEGGGFVADMPLFNCPCGTTTTGKRTEKMIKDFEEQSDK